MSAVVQFPRSTPISLLHREPDVSTIEAVRQAALADMSLTEPADITLQGIFDSTRSMVEKVSKCLLGIWNDRRRDPAILIQPLESQWPEINTAPTFSFAGYKPGTVKVAPTQLMVSEPDGASLRSGAIAPEADHVWSTPGDHEPHGV
jgi:hypothetical protein